MNSQRSTGIHTVNSVAGTIFGLPQKFFPRKYARDKEDSVLALLKFPGDSKYTMFPPFLYPDGEPKNAKHIFRSVYVAKVKKIYLITILSAQVSGIDYTCLNIWLGGSGKRYSHYRAGVGQNVGDSGFD